MREKERTGIDNEIDWKRDRGKIRLRVIKRSATKLWQTQN